MNLSNYKFEDVFTSSQGYADRFRGEVGAWLLDVQTQVITQILMNRFLKDGPLLDVGGAHGQLGAVAKLLSKQLVICASDQAAFSNLAARTDIKLQAKEDVADLLSLPYSDVSFPLVSSVRLLSHCDEWPKLVSELCRVSSERVLIDYPPLCSFNLLYSLLFPLKRKLEGNTRTFGIFRHKQIDQAFAANGFKLEERKGQFFWPMVLHRKLNSLMISKFLERTAQAIGLTKFFGNPTIAVYRRS